MDDVKRRKTEKIKVSNKNTKYWRRVEHSQTLNEQNQGSKIVWY
jgi:hypothetical protein